MKHSLFPLMVMANFWIFQFLISCAPMSNRNATAAGAATGAAGGATLGAIIGKQSGRTGEGAAIGALAGTLVGAENGPNWFGGDQTILKTERE